MGNVVELRPEDGKYEVEYVFDENDKIVAVTHPEWPFRIMRNKDKIAMVCEDTDEPFGEMDSDVFNTLLICWLLIDDPKLIDSASSYEAKNENE